MNLSQVESIVRALLYEGYLLYPYRSTALKNRHRDCFGGLFPEGFASTSGTGDASASQTQVLVRGGAQTALEVRVRFLQTLVREPVRPAPPPPGAGPTSWQEAREREVHLAPLPLPELAETPRRVAFDFPQGETREPLLTPDGRVAGLSIVRGETVRGQVRLQAEPIGRGCWRATVRVENLTPWDRTAKGQRELAQASALLSTHCILGTRGGELISLLDPPDELREAALECDNLGTFPVLVGPQGSRDTMLSSAIILYDYPAIAPESPGDLFDGTEIDEILSLRILALTDSEKAEIAAGDPRGAELLRRTESLGPQGMGRLHGALRRPDRSPAGEPGEWPAADPASGSRAGPAPGSALAVGDRVRLRPRAGAGGDIMDLVLDGRTAVVEAIERDLEDRVHLALTLEDDPARGLDLGPLPGHRFYFGPEEIERLRREGGA